MKIKFGNLQPDLFMVERNKSVVNQENQLMDIEDHNKWNLAIKKWKLKNADYLVQLINMQVTQQQQNFDLSKYTEQVQALQTKMYKTHREYMDMVKCYRGKNMQKIENLTKQLMLQAEEYIKIWDKCDAMKDQTDKLTEENNQLKQKHQVDEMVLQKCLNDKNNLAHLVSSIENQMALHQQYKKDASSKIDKLKTEIEMHKSLRDSLRAGYKKQIDEIQAKWLSQTNKVTSMSRDCRECVDMEARLAKVEKENMELGKRNRNLEKESEIYKGENRNFVNYIRSQEEIIGSQQDEIKRLKQDFANQIATLDERTKLQQNHCNDASHDQLRIINKNLKFILMQDRKRLQRQYNIQKLRIVKVTTKFQREHRQKMQLQKLNSVLNHSRAGYDKETKQTNDCIDKVQNLVYCMSNERSVGTQQQINHLQLEVEIDKLKVQNQQNELEHKTQTKKLKLEQLRKELDGLKNTNQRQYTELAEFKRKIVTSKKIRKASPEEMYETKVNDAVPCLDVVELEEHSAAKTFLSKKFFIKTKTNERKISCNCKEPVANLVSENGRYENSKAMNTNLRSNITINDSEKCAETNRTEIEMADAFKQPFQPMSVIEKEIETSKGHNLNLTLTRKRRSNSSYKTNKFGNNPMDSDNDDIISVHGIFGDDKEPKPKKSKGNHRRGNQHKRRSSFDVANKCIHSYSTYFSTQRN